MSNTEFIVLKVCNQRHYFYIRVTDETFIGDFWIQISKYGYFKLDGYYRFDLTKSDDNENYGRLITNSRYYDSFESFAINRKKVA